jgi:hypothetical protein
MARIKIIDKAKKPSIPTAANLSEEVPRFRPPGGKPPLPLTSSYNRQGTKGPKENGA